MRERHGIGELIDSFPLSSFFELALQLCIVVDDEVLQMPQVPAQVLELLATLVQT